MRLVVIKMIYLLMQVAKCAVNESQREIIPSLVFPFPNACPATWCWGTAVPRGRVGVCGLPPSPPTSAIPTSSTQVLSSADQHILYHCILSQLGSAARKVSL